MSKKSKIRAVLGSVLAAALVVTCVASYRSGSKGTPNEKEFVKENEKDSVDQAIKTEERPEEETEDVNTSNVEGTREVEQEESNTEEIETEETKTEENKTEETKPEETEKKEGVSTAAETVLAPNMNFTENSLMEWPVNGQVVLDYNMENTVYFPTLNVYKLNPAVAVSAEVGAPVAAAANGKIVSVSENEETGKTVTVDMGNGYQAVYGQLKDVQVQEDAYITAGSVVGYVNEPTKYYTKEGANLYFAMKKDGSPVDPVQYLP